MYAELYGFTGSGKTTLVQRLCGASAGGRRILCRKRRLLDVSSPVALACAAKREVAFLRFLSKYNLSRAPFKKSFAMNLYVHEHTSGRGDTLFLNDHGFLMGLLDIVVWSRLQGQPFRLSSQFMNDFLEFTGLCKRDLVVYVKVDRTEARSREETRQKWKGRRGERELDQTYAAIEEALPMIERQVHPHVVENDTLERGVREVLSLLEASK